MDFIKRMKKREFIEMALKTICAVLGAFVAIILMEGMIYGIEMNALKTNGSTASSSTDLTIAYCIEVDDDQYFIVYYNEGMPSEWSAVGSDIRTRAECENIAAKEIVFHAPSAFEFSITPIHYVIMSAFMLIVVGFFVYRFIILKKEYDTIEDNFKKTGNIEIENI